MREFPTNESDKEGYPQKTRYFTVIGSYSQVRLYGTLALCQELRARKGPRATAVIAATNDGSID